ncbi:2-alkenal reductase [Pirellula staleyi DSM 6068]|uniref:2-alkenal reductase n=1 Tax=Pirellula staleyi (strain ATCC 27377 / DSM 6068 / ICPB 4128) TaxID=530564 RepID=D2R1V9_PIRSD|nr:2-alkenal reductase [Pirellula staleyi DSM 6068]
MQRTRLCSTSRCPWLHGLLIATAALGIASTTLPQARASELRRTAIVRAVNEAGPSIVNIHGRKTVRADVATSAGYGSDNVRQVNGMGTGIVFDARGYILTNFHVVDGVSNIQVSLHDASSTIARLVAHDPKTDLAVIKVDTKEPLPVIKFGTSCDLMTGEPVIAIGNAYGYEHTVTRGIISALHRTVQVSDEQKYQNLIQTDASINPGNSGGPLMNIDGEVIGINVAVRVGAQGIGFAIPIDEALEVTAKLMSIERIDQTMHGIAGNTKHEPEQRIFTVSMARESSPAEKVGLKSGDVISKIGDREVKRSLDIELALLGRGATEEVPVEVLRDGETVSMSITLSPLKNTSRPALSDKAWDLLGLRLAPMDETEFRNLGSRYRGGLRVTAVRDEGPAAAQGIRRGDVLVGMHVWETISLENIAYVLDREDLSRLNPVIFYIIRGSDTLYGHLRVAERTKP